MAGILRRTRTFATLSADLHSQLNQTRRSKGLDRRASGDHFPVEQVLGGEENVQMIAEGPAQGEKGSSASQRRSPVSSWSFLGGNRSGASNRRAGGRGRCRGGCSGHGWPRHGCPGPGPHRYGTADAGAEPAAAAAGTADAVGTAGVAAAGRCTGAASRPAAEYARTNAGGWPDPAATAAAAG